MARRQVQLLTAAATNGVGAMGPQEGLANARSVVIFIKYNAGTSAGSVVVEAAHDKAYTGTWVNLATVAWAAADKLHQVVVTGPQMALRVKVASVTGANGVDAVAVMMD